MSIDLRHGPWERVLDDVECDALIVDAPYSERTHGGHSVMAEHLGAADNERRATKRRAIDYECWNPELVRSFVASWSGRCSGWFVTLTDHVLAYDWADALDDAGRYVFAPLPVVIPGSRVRLSGDGPSSWTVWLVVARPKARKFMSWGTLPGAYISKPGDSARSKSPRIGGKPLWLMRELVRDYSREGDLVCDPCAGGATTLLAAQLEGRRAVGAEQDAAAYAQAMEVITHGYGRNPKQEALAL